MAIEIRVANYGWSGDGPHTDSYLHQPLWSLLRQLAPAAPRRVLDLGCGNGFLASKLQQCGYAVVGVDPSPSGIAASRQRCPGLVFHQATATPAEIEALALGPFIWLSARKWWSTVTPLGNGLPLPSPPFVLAAC